MAILHTAGDKQMEEEDEDIAYEDEAVEVISLSDGGEAPLDGKINSER